MSRRARAKRLETMKRRTFLYGAVAAAGAGAVAFGHQSNDDCYVKARHADGTVTFTSHAAT